MDGSPQSREGLHHVLAEYPEAEVTVLHVIEPIETFYHTPELSDWKQWYKDAEAEANEIFADAQAVADEYAGELGGHDDDRSAGRRDRRIYHRTGGRPRYHGQSRPR
jgi:nucleotide-binding universal stress UspA family protein